MLLNRYRSLAEAKKFLVSSFDSESCFQLRDDDFCRKYQVHMILECKEERKTRRVVGKLKLSSHVSLSLIRTMNDNIRRMSGRYVRVEGKYLFVGPDTDTSLVPPDFIIVRFDEEGELNMAPAAE